MLKSYLTTRPYTKFVLIQDTIEEPGNRIFDFLVNNHIARPEHTLHYFVFHGNFGRAKARFVSKTNVVVHDFTSDVCGWNLDDSTKEDFEGAVSTLGSSDVVVVDSLAHVIFQYGLPKTYRALNILKNRTCVQQIITLLHGDLLEDRDKIRPIFEHLCTFRLSIEPKFISENGRAQYTYKKISGKVIKQLEEFRFEGENLITQKIERPDPKKLLEKSIVPEINPETLSTFRIGLSEKEKESRDQLVLPYLPKSETQTSQEEGKIFYQFDEVDDWDEEDPDDDLDI